MRWILAIAILSLATATARAEDCGNATTQAAMDDCAAASFQKSDTALNTAYKQIMARLKDDEAARKLLTTAQRDWLAYRDAECAFASSKVAGGSAYGMIATFCRDDLTTQRLKQLQTYLKCQEGDMSCPVPGR